MGRRRKGEEREIARERIETLFGLAEREIGPHPERAQRYVRLAQRIGMRYQTPLPRRLKLLSCRACGAYLHPAQGGRTRLRGGRLVVSCRACGHRYRVPLQGEARL